VRDLLLRLESFVASRSPRARWIAVLAWYCVIFTLSQMPGTDSGSTEDLLSLLGLRDLNMLMRRLAHMFVFAVEGVLVYAAIQRNFRFSLRNYCLAVATAAALGLTDELHQYLVPLRSCRIADAIVDTFGGAVGIAIVLGVYVKWARSREGPG